MLTACKIKTAKQLLKISSKRPFPGFQGCFKNSFTITFAIGFMVKSNEKVKKKLTEDRILLQNNDVNRTGGILK